MEKKRPKRGKNSYLNDFHVNLAGEYIYEGEVYACAGGEAEVKALRLRLWAYAAVIAAASVISGCISAPGMQNCFYVMLPYIGEFCAAASVVWALVRMGTDWKSIRAYVYERTVPALPRRAMAAACFAAAGFAAETVFLVLSGSGGQVGAAALFLLLRAAAFASGMLMRRQFRGANWGKAAKKADE